MLTTTPRPQLLNAVYQSPPLLSMENFEDKKEQALHLLLSILSFLHFLGYQVVLGQTWWGRYQTGQSQFGR